MTAPAPRASNWERTRANLRTIGGAITLAMVIRIALFEAFEIEGPSMEPTLLNGDRIVVSKYNFGLFIPFMRESLMQWSGPDLGDVVIVKSPADHRIDIVKRVVGVAGDTVQLREGRVFRNGKAVRTEELGPCDESSKETMEPYEGCLWARETLGEDLSYRTSRSRFSSKRTTAPLTVPEGQVYVLGDHRDRSNDSRYFGTVPVNRIKGRAQLVYFSSDKEVRWNRVGHLID